MAQRPREAVGVENSGHGNTFIFKGPISVEASGTSAQSSQQGNYSGTRSRPDLRNVSRVNVFYGPWCRQRRIDEINLYSWKSTGVKLTEGYEEEGLSEPTVNVYPRMKKGFRLYKGEYAHEVHEQTSANRPKHADYVQEEGFSLHAPVPNTEDVTVEMLVKIMEKKKHRLVSIIGPAGSGKTVFMRRLTRAIMKSGDLVPTSTVMNLLRRLLMKNEQKYEAVIHLNIRDIPACDNISVPELLLKNVFRNASDQEFKEGYLWLLQNQSKVLFLMDGFDQASWDISEEAEKIGPWDAASTSTIMHNLFSGNIFEDAKIIFSSRENAVASLPTHLRPSVVVALVGLSSDDARKLFISLLGKEGQTAWDRLSSSANEVVRLFKIPLFLLFAAILCKNHPEYRAHSMSEVLSGIIQILPKSNNTIKGKKLEKVIKKLKKMAFHGIMEGRVSFTYKDLKTFELDKEIIKDLIIGVPGWSNLCQNLFDGDYVFFFCHQTIQEILAAYYIRGMDFEEFSSFVKEYLSQDFWFVVFRLLYGISLDQKVLGIISSDIVPSILPEKQEMLRKALKEMLEMPLTPLKRLGLSWIVCEASDTQLLDAHGSKVQVQGITLPGDSIFLISLVARHFKGLQVLSLVNCGIDAEFLDLMSTYMKGLEWEQIDISQNSLSYNECIVLGNLVQVISFKKFVMDLPNRDGFFPPFFDIEPGLLTLFLEDSSHFSGKFCFNLRQRNLLLYDEEPHVLTKQKLVGEVDELSVLVKVFTPSVADDILNISKQLNLQRDEFGKFSCNLVIEKLVFEDNSSRLDDIQKFVDLALALKKIQVLELSLEKQNIDDRILSALLNLPRSVSIRVLNLSKNECISCTGWKWLGKIISLCKVNHFYALSCELTDEKLENFVRESHGASISHLNVEHNPKIGHKGWFYIGTMVEGLLRVLEADSIPSEGILALVKGARGAMIDILKMQYLENDAISVISTFVKEDILLTETDELSCPWVTEELKRIKPRIHVKDDIAEEFVGMIAYVLPAPFDLYIPFANQAASPISFETHVGISVLGHFVLTYLSHFALPRWNPRFGVLCFEFSCLAYLVRSVNKLWSNRLQLEPVDELSNFVLGNLTSVLPHIKSVENGRRELSPYIFFSWDRPFNYSHTLYDINAEIDGKVVKEWCNYPNEFLTIKSFRKKGLFRLVVYTKLFCGFKSTRRPAYSSYINLETFNVHQDLAPTEVARSLASRFLNRRTLLLALEFMIIVLK